MKTKDLETILKGDDLDEALKYIGKTSFSAYLCYLIKASGFDNGDILKNANIERSYYYQILKGVRMPSKDKVIALSLALKLDIDKTDRLLKLSNNGSLYPKIKRDAVIMFAIAHGFDLYKTNELLIEHDLRPM